MNYETLFLYCIVSFFYIISPGPAIFLAIYNGAMNGIRCVALSALGNIIGLMCLSALSITGLSAILLASSTLFFVVKVIGAAYLVYLGIKQIRSSHRTQLSSDPSKNYESRSLSSFFKEGLLVAVTNPKPIIFFAALFPQFLDTQSPIFPQFVVMTLIFMAFSFMSLFSYGFLANRAKRFFENSRNVALFHRLSGGLFVGMGVSLVNLKAAN